MSLSACLLALAALQDPTPVSTELDEVIVTGALTAPRVGTDPIRTVDRGQLQTAGVLDLSRAVRLLPANSGSENQVDQLNQPQSSGTAQFNLRNLGLGSTLVLIDGQRQTASAVVSSDGSTFTDINSLVPLIALERLEVLTAGASATYGSDAVAGVVNLITRRSVDGPELRIDHAAARGSAETLIQALGGSTLFGGDLLVAASWFHRDALGSDQRRFTQAETYGRPAWSAVTSYGQPGSYFIPSRGAFAPDPDCADPAFTSAFRNSPSDPFCRLDYSDFFDLAPEEDRGQAWASWTRNLNGVELRLQGAWTGSRTTVRQSPSLPILAGSPRVPEDHPANPFGEEVLFRGRLLGAEAGPSTALFDYDTRRLAGDLRGRWSDAWSWRASAAWSRQTVFYDKPDVIGSRLDLALRGLGGPDCQGGGGAASDCLTYNPFGSAQLNPALANTPDLIDWLTGYTGLRGRASLLTAGLVVNGDLIRTPDLRVQVAHGLEVRDSRLRHDWSDLANAGELLTAGRSPDVAGDQRVLAAFGEARLTWRNRFEGQFGFAAERYEDSASHLSPRAAVSYAITDHLSARVSWDESFKAPSIFALAGAQAAQPSVFDRGAFVFVNTVTRGDPHLRPERGRSWSAGLDIAPFAGLSFGLQVWRHDLADVIVKQSAQAVIDAATADDLAGRTGTPAQSRVQRDPTGSLRFVDLSFVNAARVTAQGLDVSAGYSAEAWGADWSVQLDWAYVDRFEVQDGPGAAVVSAAGKANAVTIARAMPRNQTVLHMARTTDTRLLSATLRRQSAYENDRAGITAKRIGASTTLDLAWRENLTDDWAVEFSLANALDADPPLAQFALGYDAGAHDPRGRIIRLSLERSW